MTEEIVNGEGKVTETTTEVATETATETPTTTAGKTFTQDEVNKIVNDRLARERTTIDKKIEEQTASFKEKEATLTKEAETLKATLSQNEKKILGYEKGISNDKLDEALVLANLKVEKDGVTLAEALDKVVVEFPNLVKVGKVGVEITNQPSATNPYITKKLAARFPHLVKK